MKFKFLEYLYAVSCNDGSNEAYICNTVQNIHKQWFF